MGTRKVVLDYAVGRRPERQRAIQRSPLSAAPGNSFAGCHARGRRPKATGIQIDVFSSARYGFHGSSSVREPPRAASSMPSVPGGTKPRVVVSTIPFPARERGFSVSTICRRSARAGNDSPDSFTRALISINGACKYVCFRRALPWGTAPVAALASAWELRLPDRPRTSTLLVTVSIRYAFS
jgi:hypothetical protein